MKAHHQHIVDEFTHIFSLKVDLRNYENLNVTLENGTKQKLNMLARISLKTPEIIMINFTENPAIIKAAKNAIEKSELCANPQQDGVILFVPVPKPSRERREQISTSAKKIFNVYKKGLNDVSF